MAERHVRLVMPHQLFETHLEADPGTTFVLVEHDLLFRQYRFHQQKLVLHRAGLRRFADRLREAGFAVEAVETDAATTSRDALASVVRRLAPTLVTVFDVVDDWLSQDLTLALADGGYELGADDVLDTPNFLTSRQQVADFFGGATRARMAAFYEFQRRRLDVLMDGDQPLGGRWSFDEENRKKLPKGHPVPEPHWPERHPVVDEAIAWVQEEFGDNPGNAEAFAWPTSHAEAEEHFEHFLAERFAEFGPYEDALPSQHPWVFHSLITPSLNLGLLSPHRVLARALEVGESDDVPLASVEGYVRQIIGWREYMRATYVVQGRRMRTGNRLQHARPLERGWWTGETGLAPVDHVVRRVLEHGWAHHIERLMVLGNAMCLTRVDPDAAYEWFMEMFVDAYDWVMVPNVYAMSQFAAGESITTKPYVSGSNYLRKMSDYAGQGWDDGKGGARDWQGAWDGLYWTFVRDHREVFERNARSNFAVRTYDGFDAATKARHTRNAAPWLG